MWRRICINECENENKKMYKEMEWLFFIYGDNQTEMLSFVEVIKKSWMFGIFLSFTLSFDYW